ncbi:MAG: methionine--tRNA ligase [Ferroplasma sp.]
MEKEKILVNCALPYTNGPLHLGHIAGAYLGADIFVRFNRLNNKEVLFISGSDEYGTPITITAEKNKVSPQDIANKYHDDHDKTFKSIDIIFDEFTRTTDPEHIVDVDDFFLNLYNKGYLEKRYMVSPYCRKSKRFMPDRYIEGECPYCGFKEARGDQCDNCGRTLDPIELINPVCKLSNETPVFRETEHFFLRLDLLQDRLLSYIDSKVYWKPNVLKFTKNFIDEGLRPRAITRDLDWGVRIPLEGYQDKKVYVWFEALIGYITGARTYSEKTGRKNYWKEFWMDMDVKSYYFIGKDNIPFHAIIWPAMLIAHGGYNMPYNVPANEYLRFEGEQFSKSRGIGYTVNEILNYADKDSLRYYMSSILPENGDSDFSLHEMQDKVNSEFVDKYGNYIYRIESFIDKNRLKIKIPKGFDEYDSDILKTLKEKFRLYCIEIENLHIKRGLSIWLELVMLANNYFTISEPWKLIKTDRALLNEKLFVSLKISQYLTAMLYPYVPSASERIWETLGIKTKIAGSSFEELLLDYDFTISRGDVPFKKLDFSNPDNLDLRTGRIISVEDHPNADNLYIIKIKAGKEYTAVSDLKKFYSRDQLINKSVIALINIEPSRIRDVNSNAIIFTEEINGGRNILASDGEEGDEATVGDFRFNGTSISFKDFSKTHFLSDKGHLAIEIDKKIMPVKINNKFIISQNKDGKISIK